MELLYEDVVVLWAVFRYKKVALGHFWLTLGPLGGAYWTHDADMYGLVGPEDAMLCHGKMLIDLFHDRQCFIYASTIRANDTKMSGLYMYRKIVRKGNNNNQRERDKVIRFF